MADEPLDEDQVVEQRRIDVLRAETDVWRNQEQDARCSAERTAPKRLCGFAEELVMIASDWRDAYRADDRGTGDAWIRLVLPGCRAPVSRH